MCELFGVSGDHRINLNEYLSVLGMHSERHPHGWGYAALNGNRIELIREPRKAADSRLFHALLETGVTACCAMAHIRYATIGNVEYANCHPFTARSEGGRSFVLIHNGTIFDGPSLRRWLKCQEGDTDSERILLYLTDRVNEEENLKGDLLSARERCSLLDQEICTLSRRNKLNLILYDGEILYAHSNCRNTLYWLRKNGIILIATVPLSDEAWEPFPFLQLLGIRQGSVVYEGHMHEHEYVLNEEDLKTVYRNYSLL